MRANVFRVTIPAKPPAALSDWERRHNEPWDERWKRLTGKTSALKEKKILGPKVHSVRQLSAAKINQLETQSRKAKARKPPRRKVVMVADSKPRPARMPWLRPRAQIPDLIFGLE